jgi:hypothetical protein
MRVPSGVFHGGSGSVAAASDGEAAIVWGRGQFDPSPFVFLVARCRHSSCGSTPPPCLTRRPDVTRQSSPRWRSERVDPDMVELAQEL